MIIPRRAYTQQGFFLQQQRGELDSTKKQGFYLVEGRKKRRRQINRAPARAMSRAVAQGRQDEQSEWDTTGSVTRQIKEMQILKWKKSLFGGSAQKKRSVHFNTFLFSA